mgnify:CR=1 FL=1
MAVGSQARQTAWRLFRGSSVALGLGLAVKELHDTFFEEVQVDARARLFLGLEPEAIAARMDREKRLRHIMASAEMRSKEILAQHGGNAAAAQRSLMNLRGQLVDEAHGVMYPSISKEELQQRRQTFGNVKWTEEVMQRLLSYSPLVEVGAGEGQWQAELRRRGADVVAFDNHSSPSRFDAAASRIVVPGAEVQQADAGAAVSQSAGRTLLMVYPPPGEMAVRCLQCYKGETLIYVGEGRGGVNGDNTFFDLLAEKWKLEDTMSLDTLPWSYESVYVLKRAAAEDTAE